MNQDLLRIIDSICRDKNIDRDGFIADLEGAMASAVRKAYNDIEDAEVKLDLASGDISATIGGKPVDMHILGRIAAQTAKQVIIQRTRERERASIYEDYTGRRGTIVTGTVARSEGGNLLVNLGRAEGFLPRSEQIPGETHAIGDRLRVLVLEVREQPNQVKIILSRSSPEFILRLFELEVPEVAEQIIELKTLAREAGYRTKVAVASIDSKVDAVGACVGVRGSRIKNIVEELGGEKIDIVRFNESSQILIQNALKPAEVQEIALCLELGKATVIVLEDQLSLAIGKRGQNVRLAARLSRWDIDILTPAEHTKNLENMAEVMRQVEGVDDVLIDKLIAIGCISVADIDEIGPEELVNALEITRELAERVVEAAGEEVIRLEEEREAARKAQAELEAAGVQEGEAEAATPTDLAEATPEEAAYVAEPDAAAGTDGLAVAQAGHQAGETSEAVAEATMEPPAEEHALEPAVSEAPPVPEAPPAAEISVPEPELEAAPQADVAPEQPVNETDASGERPNP